MNEWIVLTHLAAIIGLVMLTGRWGKEPLGCLAFLFLLISNLFINKEMHVFGVNVTTCDVYTIGCILSLNLIQEMSGKKESRRYLYRSILFLLIFLLMSRFQVAYRATDYSMIASRAYDVILQHSARIVAASLIVTWMSDRFDIYWFNYLKKTFPEQGFSFRFICSTLVSQILDTVAFYFLGLYGIVENLIHCMLVTYLAKLLCILGSGALFSLLPRKYYKNDAALRETSNSFSPMRSTRRMEEH